MKIKTVGIFESFYFVVGTTRSLPAASNHGQSRQKSTMT
jgi:hypothetical protein